MLDKLEKAASILPKWLAGEEELGWSSLLIDYDYPHVWRLWRQLDDDHRVMLHKIFPCSEGLALPHPHPWPSAVRIFIPLNFDGATYETAVGWASPEAAESPPLPATFHISSSSTYEMLDPRAWHYVRPIGSPVYSIMVVGKPFKVEKQKRFGQGLPKKVLTLAQRADIIGYFRGLVGVV